jgi:hypothetical protein
MNQEIKTKWLAALRSGDYQQGTGRLRVDDKYCCLGVLCDLHAKATNHEWEDTGIANSRPDKNTMRYLAEVNVLPYVVQVWADVNGPNPCIYSESKQRTQSLSRINDDGGTFNEIANTIEELL